MLVNKSLSFRGVMRFSGHHLVWLFGWMLLIASLYYYTQWSWMTIPWLPVSLIGTAVAFYVGFKNNQAYDRLWEGRKVWGGIVNSSRAWGSVVRSFIRNHENSLTDAQVNAIKRQMIHRHIAWLYTLRQQLLQPTQWEHLSIEFIGIGRYNQRRSENYGLGLYKEESDPHLWQKYLNEAELAQVQKQANPAAHLIDRQAQQLAELHEQSLLDSYKLSDMQRILNDLYDHQGRVERIKRFPLPRQYSSLSFIFVCIFIFLLPLAIVAEFAKLGDYGVWLSIPFGTVIGWVYVNMELVGDYSENPFEGLFNDVPMLSICRNIEIDLLQMLGETNVPAPIQAKNGVLM